MSGTRPAAGPAPVVRPATPADVDAIHALVRGLAEYEREPDAVVATAADLRAALFGEHPAVFASVVDAAGGPESTDDPGGALDGFALWFLTYSTWEGRHGIHLEDLYVRPQARGRGVGRALLHDLAATAVERGYRRVEWAVLDWNEPAIGFYRSLGAVPMDEWTTFRLDGDALTAFAGDAR